MHDTVTSNNGPTSVLDILKSKHPPGELVSKSALILEPAQPENVHPFVFDFENATLLRYTALLTSGAAGLSGLDAKDW